jgi:O-antigen/teichoic acid export membrane protein
MSASAAAARANAAPDFRQAAVLRGSSMLLAGRVMAMTVAMLTQVLVVRYLGKASYGTFAYGLALSAVVQAILPLGLDRADTRFLALYDEHGDHRRLLGVVATEASVILATGATAVALVWAGRGLIGVSNSDGVGFSVVLPLVCVAPLAALDAMVLNVFAVFARPKAVFFRRYVLDPGLRLFVVILLVTLKMSVTALAVGYLAAGVCGTLLYSYLVVRLLRGVVPAEPDGRRRIVWPGRPLLLYALPLLIAALAYSATTSLPAVLLGKIAAADDVAELRAIQPVAALVLVVPTVFGTLFTPQVARLLARDDHAAVRAHYWSTATWVATIAFPVAVVLIAFPLPVATTLFGSRYAGAAPMLAVLGVAFYLSAAFGLNGSVLQVAGRLRALTVANLVGLAIAPAASAALIPRYHGMGAAIAVALAVVVPQLIKQRSLGSTPVGSTHRGAIRLWVVAPALIALSACAHMLFRPTLPAAIAIATVASVVLFLCMRSVLDVAEVFPIAAPLLRRIDRGLRRLQWRPDVAAGTDNDDATPPDEPGGLGAWHGIDWRFLLPSPDFGRVWLAPGCAHEQRSLEAIGLSTTTAVDDDVDVAFVDARALDLPALERTLPPGTLVRIAVSRDVAGAGRRWSPRPWSARCRQLRSRGWRIEAAAWAAPSVRQPRAYAPVNDRLAIRRLLRVSPAGWSGVVRGWLGLALTQVGLAQVVCREGVLLARTPR